MKIAVSLLSSYLYCSRKVFLEKVFKLREPLRQPLILGTIRHEALELATKAERDIVISIGKNHDASEILRMYTEKYAAVLREVVAKYSSSLEAFSIDAQNAYEGAFPTLYTEAKSRAINTISFFEKTRFSGLELWENLTPKISSEVRIESPDLGLIGIVDQVHDFGNSVVPIELKTGKMPKEGVWPGHRVQAAAYALMLSEIQGKPVNQAIVHYLDSNEKRTVVMNPFMKEEIVQLIGEVRELIENTILPEYCDSMQKCNACGLRKKCYDPILMQSLLNSVRGPRERQLQLE